MKRKKKNKEKNQHQKKKKKKTEFISYVKFGMSGGVQVELPNKGMNLNLRRKSVYTELEIWELAA